MLYEDGVSPVDGLTKNDDRKVAAIYWGFLEFGMDTLFKEGVWVTHATIRESLIKKVDGGLSHVVKLLLKRFFFDVGGNHFERSGIALKCHGDVEALPVLTAGLGMLLCDEVALADILLCKGHAGYKLCVCFANVILHRYSGQIVGNSDWAVCSTCTDLSKIVLHTDESIKETMARRASLHGVLDKAEADGREKLLGFTYNSESLLLDEELAINVASIVQYDWMHIYLVGGLLAVEFGLVMRKLYGATENRADVPTVSYALIGKYVEQWKWPKALNSVTRLFSEQANKKHRENSSFSRIASQMPTLVPVLRCFSRWSRCPSVAVLMPSSRPSRSWTWSSC